MNTFTQLVGYKPSLFCVGVVTEVGNGKVSNSENYIVNAVKISAMDSGRDTTVFLLTKPYWLTAEFNTVTKLRQFKDDHTNDNGRLTGEAWVYSANINCLEEVEEGKQRPPLSALRGLAGSHKGFEKLSDRLLSLEVPAGTDGPSIEDTTNVLRDFLENNTEKDGTPKLIGYTLEQETVRTDEVDEATGKTIWMPTKNYVLSRNNFAWWDVTKKNVDYFTKKAEDSIIKEGYRNAGQLRYKMTYTQSPAF